MTNYIKEMANAIAGNLIPCIKQEVFAMLVCANGSEFFGANWMTADGLSVCPRVTQQCVSGEGYHLCKEVCNQSFHAERFALHAASNAGIDATGGTMYVVGHTYCCDDCIANMQLAGVKTAIVIDSGKVYNF